MNFTESELEAAKAALLADNTPWVGELEANAEIRALRVLWADTNGVSRADMFSEDAYKAWSNQGMASEARLRELLRAARISLAGAPDALHHSQYGGVYQLLIDGSVVAEFVPGVAWSQTYRLLENVYGEELSYRWKPVSRTAARS